MKRMTVLLALVLSLLLAACGGPAEAVLERDGLLCYPGLRWGMTAEEALEVLGGPEYEVLQDDDLSGKDVYAHIYKYYDIAISGTELYRPAQELRLFFRAYSREAAPMLDSVMVVYGPDTDAEALRAAVEAELGPGVPVAYMPEYIWEGTAPDSLYMSEEWYLETAAQYVDHGALALLQFPATRLSLLSGLEGHDLKFYDLEEGQTALYFSGSLADNFQLDPRPQYEPVTGRTAMRGGGVLVYPGTMWSMTAGEVRAALGVDAPVLDGVLTAELPFGGQMARVSFTFETWFDDLEPGLTRVEVRAGGLEAYLEETLGASGGDGWSGEKNVSDFQSPVKTEWYQELTGMDPETTAASTACYDGQVLCLESPLTLAAQLNQSEKPDPYEEVKALFEKGAEDKWYQMALSCVYESPDRLDLGELFQGWIGEGFTEAELAVVKERYDEATIGAAGQVSVTEAEMETILNRYFGVTLDQCDLGTFDQSWMYCEETGAWLNLSMGGGFVPEILEAETLDNGDVVLTYTRRRGDTAYAVTLRKNGGQWQILSNITLE